MAALVYIEEFLGTDINNTPIISGHLHHGQDNKYYYDDINNNRVVLTNVIYVVSHLVLDTLIPDSFNLYIVNDGSIPTPKYVFYIYNHNNIWQVVTDSYEIPSYLIPSDQLVPITLTKNGVAYGPRTMLRCVFNSNGESLDDLVNFKDASTTQRGTVILYDNYDSVALNSSPTSNALNKLYKYLISDAFKAHDTDLFDGLDSTRYLQYGAPATPNGTSRINYSGYMYATRVYNAVYNDYAEFFERNLDDIIEVGDVIVKDSRTGNYTKSTRKYDKKVVGVYSGEYGQCLGGKGDDKDEENYISVGLAGRVHVKVIGMVEDGDLLVSSEIPGVAMKCENYTPGTVIGKCLENKTDMSVSMIKMLIMNI